MNAQGRSCSIIICLLQETPFKFFLQKLVLTASIPEAVIFIRRMDLY